jgi:hypothetical protein
MFDYIINYSLNKNGKFYGSESARSNLLLIIQYIHTLSNDCSISSWDLKSNRNDSLIRQEEFDIS